ncbi:hypothetical protein BMJ35_13955 [Sinorhizobium medicae]|uniref:hypothetical protein n=1 Tax=Sinorhizobium medicae TaxID=110321 RepID=UPI000C7C7E2F|nr:hypothetical protein [Sinorhizobium medicae]MDX0801657.1 hypothetical protein [Sinorhizobium medicae]PLT89646.1 hypothetical protein BMJ35_13955 [Sinorhizobium medicae]
MSGIQSISSEPQQVELNPFAPGVANPAQQAFNITVHVPEQIAIRMVDASALSEYEYHIFAASLVFGGVIGFFVPCVQEFRSDGALAVPFLMMALILMAIFIAALSMAASKRRKLTRSGKEIKLTTTGATI